MAKSRGRDDASCIDTSGLHERASDFVLCIVFPEGRWKTYRKSIMCGTGTRPYLRVPPPKKNVMSTKEDSRLWIGCELLLKKNLQSPGMI